MMEKFYKLVYDVNCFYVFTAFLLYLVFHMETDMLAYGVLMLAILLHTFSEQFASKKVLTIVALALPMVCLVRESSTLEKMQFILPWIYLAIVILRDFYGLYYEDFKIRFTLVIAAVIFMIAFFGYTEDMVTGKTAITLTVPFIIILLMSGVLLMQNLRFHVGGSGKKKFEKHQMKQAVVFFLFSVLITVGKLMELIYEYVIFPVVKAIMDGFLILTYLMYDWIVRDVKLNEQIQEEAEKVQRPISQVTPIPQPEVIQEAEQVILQGEELAETAPDWTVLYVCAGVALAILLFVVLLGTNKHKGKDAVIEDEREELAEAELPEKKLKKHSIHPDIMIRYYYLKFMELASSEKAKVTRSDTTEEIQEKFLLKKYDKSEEAKELTKLYQKTRYTKEAVTREDAARMKSLLKKISA